MSGYQEELEKLGIKQSMSRKGNCHDNAPLRAFSICLGVNA
jgi:putative transposase